MTQNFLNNTTHNVAWFTKRHAANELELKAPFQRNPVWTDKQKAFLIDTMLRGYPIPELYMQEYVGPQGNERYTVVDGQQRLRACIEFIEGKFPLDAEDSADFADMYFNDLGQEQKKAIYNYNFVVRILPEMPDADLRAMFTRLNRNVVALNSQELRHATYWGEFIQTMEKIADDVGWLTLGIFTQNDVRRMLDVEFISELAVAYLHGLQNKKEQLDDWYRAYEKNFERKDDVLKVFGSVINEILAAFPDIGRTRWRKKSDFYTLFLLLARHVHLVPLSREGRQDLRKVLLDLDGWVNTYLADPQTPGIPADAIKYALAVERAASDLANRKERERVLSGALATMLAGEQRARSVSESPSRG